MSLNDEVTDKRTFAFCAHDVSLDSPPFLRRCSRDQVSSAL